MRGIKLIIAPKKKGRFPAYRLKTKNDGATQNETVSASESNSTPNLDEIPNNLAILPSNISSKPANNIKSPAL